MKILKGFIILNVKYYEMEEWKVCEEHTNYSVSNLGNVKNNKTGRILARRINSGYDYLCFPEGKQYLTHRLVATAFIPNPDNLPNIDHIDRNPYNNRLENLRWITQSNNIRNYSKASNKTSKYKGVGFHKGNKKFRAFITFEGKSKTIGYFKTEEEGARAYNDFILSHSLEEYTPLNDLV